MLSDCALSHSRSPVDLQSEQLCGHRGPARGRAPVQILCGRPLDAGSQRGEWLLLAPWLTDSSTAHGNVLTSQAVATSKTGVVNNTIQVKRTDFEVFDALRIDSEDTADFSGSVGFNVLLLTSVWRLHRSLSCSRWADLSSSPPGPYQQEAYLVRPEDKLKHPPVLPPHLLQVLLNKDTGISVSPEQNPA